MRALPGSIIGFPVKPTLGFDNRVVYLESYKVIPKRNYLGVYGSSLLAKLPEP